MGSIFTVARQETVKEQALQQGVGALTLLAHWCVTVIGF